MKENSIERNNKGKVFFIITCVAFALSAIVSVFWLIVFSQSLADLVFAQSNQTVLGVKLSMIILLVLWMLSMIVPVISMILSGVCIKFRKISIVFLAITGVMVVLQIILIAVILNTNVSIPSSKALVATLGML